MSVNNSFSLVLPYFPAALQVPLSNLSEPAQRDIQEVRLRQGRAMHVAMNGIERVVTKQGQLAAEPASGCLVTRDLLDLTFKNICSHSLHSCQNAIRQGFVTIAGGCRVGLCGSAVMQDGTLETVRAVSSLNFRIASARTGCADSLARDVANGCGGVLLCGAPASGKTTMLRDLARILGSKYRVCVMDERGEIAAVQNGIPQFDLGAQTDVFDGYPKAAGIAIAVRVMAPQILICDELGDAAETDALLQSLHTGVRLIASAHAADLSSLFARPHLRKLIDAGAFETAVFLGSGSRCGQVLRSETIRQVCA